METLQLRGAMTALITPFRNGSVDEKALGDLVERQLKGGINGLVPCGTTGESATMSAEECLRVIQIVAEAAQSKVPVIAGTGSNDTAKSIAFTQKASKIKGVDAALVVCPYYNKPNSFMVERHFEAVANEGGLPVVLYNVPGRTVISMTVDVIARLAKHENIIAIKEATGDLRFDAELFDAVSDNPDFSLLSGDDFTTMPFVASGGHGCISVLSNLDPGMMASICALSASGDLVKARQRHLKIQKLTAALFERANPVPTKALAALLGWCTDEVRAPLYPVEPAFVEQLAETAKAYGLLS